AHYVPPSKGKLINLKLQPSSLLMIIWAGINQVIGDAIYETAYCPVNTVVHHHHTILWNVAKSLKYKAYAKRLQDDFAFGSLLSQVLNGHLSGYHSAVKQVATGKVEGFYQLVEGPGCSQAIEALTVGSTYIYPMKLAPGGSVIDRSKPFAHPAVIAVLRELYFAYSRSGSHANKYQNHFKSSLPETHPASVELEIPGPMLVLVATCIHSALDDFHSGTQRKVDFSADWYEDIYKTHMEFLSHTRKGSITKYHRLMASLYTQLS
ncbi:hypothetical protein EDB83DRAFT_2218790, partial [Lactarius deliciosus]